jgi:hypothetical protein
VRISDHRATVPTGIRRVRAALLGSDGETAPRRADPLADPLGGSDPTALPHRRARALPPPVA